jgi:hypothetical protein
MNIDTLRQIIRNLDPLPADAKPFTWTHHRQALRDKILNENPAAFCTWPTVRCTMFVGDNDKTRQRYDSIIFEDNHVQLGRGLSEHSFGKPPRLFYTRGNYSGNTVNQVYHLLQGNINPSALSSVVEIGGGFGAMAAIFWRMGFRGTYTIVDLPEFSALQRYYLSHVAADLDAVFVADGQRWADTQHGLNVKPDLFLGLCSLSEIDDLALRAMLLNAVRPNMYFIAAQSSFFGVDNVDWFRWYAGTKKGYLWDTWENETEPGHFYLRGVRR